jgi:hypothetical protein
LSGNLSTNAIVTVDEAPVLMAGAEMIKLRNGKGAGAGIHDDAVHFGRPATAAPAR